MDIRNRIEKQYGLTQYGAEWLARFFVLQNWTDANTIHEWIRRYKQGDFFVKMDLKTQRNCVKILTTPFFGSSANFHIKLKEY